ncbi:MULTISPECIES: hypothetical protein [Streptomyces]|uniref:hypothetical protein n=1 Tax=Streptomyces TaxID=1883 RepID=UPI00163BDC00|nr:MULTISPECIES: hypothetical protein [Streptomyces]MBC2875128.1 hypothetical protein [Streptomyces sp. TYQ1024]UKW29556.1 hypothetical protein MCU78_11145 [Streptomyces sp. TYQ1024]
MTETRALIEEAAKKSGLIWVQGPTGPSRALWHVWHEGAVLVVGGPGEQPVDDLGLVDGGTASVTVRSKDKGGRLVEWTAAVAELAPGGEEWGAAVAELKGKRLNASDAETIAERWARTCRVLRLAPTGATAPLPDGALTAVPLPTPATTRRAMPAGLPRLLRRGRRG